MTEPKSNEKIVDELLEKHLDKETLAGVDMQQKEDDVEDEIIKDESKDSESENEEEDSVEEILTDSQLIERKKEILDLKEQGNENFRKGDYTLAIQLYNQAGLLCKPKVLHNERAILYSNRAASELKLNLPKAAIHSASKAIRYNPNFPKGYLRRAKAYDQEDKLDESLEDYKKVLELDRQSREAHEAIPNLEKRINERNENMKTEMMAKLKDLGNLVLRPFGLSTSNFQMNQDPNTGGYSINFKQN